LLKVETEFEPEHYSPAEIYTGGPSKSENFDIYSVIEDVISENALAPPDLKINDREWPEAKNFFEFCINDKFLKVKPYIMQVAIAVITLAEYCPCCSNTDYLFNKIRATDSYGKFRKYVVLLEHGVCPVCRKDRRRLVRKHGLKFYDELAASAGQRAGKSALVAMISAYILHRMLKLQNPNEVYGLMSSNVLHGTFVALTFGQAKENLWDPFYGNILESPWFCLSEGTPVSLPDGSTKPIELVAVGEEVATFEGTGVVSETFANGTKECLTVTLESGQHLTATPEHQVQCLSSCGNYLVWKRVGDLSIDDLVVADGKIVHLSKVSSIHDAGTRKVFDLTVTSTHNYFAGGISVHNCGYNANLLDFSRKRGDELVKLKDNFINYKHRRLLIYPASPDKRILRGRCLPGNSLINTSNGLIRVEEESKLLGSITRKGLSRRVITDHVVQPSRKKVLRALLSNGLELDATPDHRVLVLNDSLNPEWVEQKDLLGKYVFCQLGGDFPKSYHFNHDIALHKPIYVQIAEYISSGNDFTIDELAEYFDVHKNSVLSYHLGPLLKEGVLDRHPVRNHVGHPLPSIYSINKNFILEDWTLLRRTGKFTSYNSNKAKVKIPSSLTTELSRLIGYLISDGDLSFSGNSIAFCTTSRAKAKDFFRLFVSVFGCKPRLVREAGGNRRSGYGPTGEGSLYTIAFSYKSILSFFEFIGLHHVCATTKTLPTCILEAPRECLVECLSAMVSCDGGIVSRSDFVGVYYATKSYELSKMVQLLFMRLGYPCRRYPHLVRLTRDASVKFLQEYTGLNKRSYKNDISLTLATGRKSVLAYKIPYSNSYVDFDTELDPKCARYQDKDLIFARVESLESLGKKVVYDITVDNPDSAFPANGVLVHNTRFLGAIDEIGWMDNDASSKKIKANATETYASLGNSLRTIRSKAERLMRQGFFNVPTGYFLNISSPSSARDKIMDLVKKAQGSKKTYGVHRPTWELNPDVTRESLAEDFRRDPVGAMRDFGAQPPLSSSPFIGNPQTVLSCLSDKKNFIEISYARKRSPDGSMKRFAKLNRVKASGMPSIMAIDAGYCLPGDTLVPTQLGLKSIGDLVEFPPRCKVGYSIPLGIKVGTQGNPEVASHVIYSGIKPLLQISTKSGHFLKLTRKHPVLVQQGMQLNWVEAKDLKIGDTLCVNPVQITRKKRLPLNLSDALPVVIFSNSSGVPGVYGRKRDNKWTVMLPIDKVQTHFGIFDSFEEAASVRNKFVKQYGLHKHPSSTKKVVKPRFMTPELAFIIGALISEGHFNEYHLSMANTNLDYLDKLDSCFEKVFGRVPKRFGGKKKPGREFTINGRETRQNFRCYALALSSKPVCSWLKELGVLSSEQYGQKSSYHKNIPACILQADTESQKAFMAAYIEGDGSIAGNRQTISVWSKSSEFLYQFQLLLNTHGVLSNIRKGCLTTATANMANSLYWLVEKYLTHKHKSIYLKEDLHVGNTSGVPSSSIQELLDNRLLTQHRSRYGVVHSAYLDDSGEEVTLDKLLRLPKLFLYDMYKVGEYKELLAQLRLISRQAVENLEHLLKLRYQLTPIVSISSAGKAKVYDLSVSPSNPSFIANGLVVHNSNNSFALSIGHKRNGVPQIDLLVEVQPLPGMPLSYRSIYDHLMKPLIEQRNVQVVAADRWNSLKLLSDIEEDFDIVTVQHSLRYAEMQLFKEYVEDKELLFPCLPKGESIDTVLAYNADDYPNCFAHNPVGHFILQLVTVQDTGSAVIKGEQLTDDLARASMLAVSLLLDEEYKMFWEKPIAETANVIDVTQMAISRGVTGGVFGGTGGNSGGSSSIAIGRVISRSDS